MISCILSCEHASSALPDEFQALYSQRFLLTHRGYDRGALQVFQAAQSALNLWGKAGNYSRLLVDLNRSEDSSQLFSTRALQQLLATEKSRVIEHIYLPYRREIFKKISREVELGNQVIHISIHSFTPILKGVKRACDIGFLFDPSRQFETKTCTHFFDVYKNEHPNLTISYNQPYAGTDDGLTTYLREYFKDNAYAGIEIEFNQRLIGTKSFAHCTQTLIQALKNLIN